MKNCSYTLAAYTAHREWTEDGIVILSAQVSLPRCVPDAPGDRHFRRPDRFYRQYARSFFRFCCKEVLPAARQAFREAVAASRPLPETRASLRSTVTFRQGALLSLYTDLTVQSPAGRYVHRTADTWDLTTGYPVSLGCCFPPRTAIKKELLRRARSQAAQLIDAGEAVYLEEYRRLLRCHFSPHRFFLTPEGLCWFYQRCSIAPAEEGVPVFFLPYGELGLQKPVE